ncbi:glycosyltransferase family 4 protein [Seonamhaeicola marinus]|uniref:Glycosyltransferase family 4 protein n=1 Tax=Seonamhaeicola marinus TaxID=1912246 RepID=A0A5D0HP67_9FLAO|nr:glycosyltransferase family 4 protein [Seonamhaeicola marinus]TYA71867.1 glycosyltransferase family 4 protein [Seonamhaeicola marinus]
MTSVNKNIAFVIPSLGPGGAERVVVTLANRLCAKYNILLILLYKEHNILYDIDSRIKISYCAEYLKESTNFINAFKNNKRNISIISNFIKDYKINLLIGFTTTSNILSVLSAKRCRIPCIISDRSNPYATQLSSFWRLIRYLTYPRCNYLVVQSKLSLEFYKNVKLKKLKVLPNPLSENLTLKRKSSTKENIILYVGRLDSNKAQDVLLKAFSNLKETRKNWKLVLVGDGNKRKTYETLTKDLGIEDSVVFTGRINNPEIYYNKAKIFAFTSKSEGFPNALIEAMYFGLPCVSTDCPSGPSELIEDNTNGFLIPVGDVLLLEQKLKTLIENEQLRNEMLQKAKSKGEEFHVNNVSDKWEKLIIKLL